MNGYIIEYNKLLKIIYYNLLKKNCIKKIKESLLFEYLETIFERKLILTCGSDDIYYVIITNSYYNRKNVIYDTVEIEYGDFNEPEIVDDCLKVIINESEKISLNLKV